MDINKIHYAEITISAVSPKQYPNDGLPEVALAGRSNVGKSSFINTMVNRKKLARTSGKPGKTRTLNYFNIENELFFVDVPGYGYAKVSNAEQEKWGKMMNIYFSSREELSLSILLVDLRHHPTDLDVQMYDFLKYYNLPVLVVATKADKIKKSKRNKHINQVIQTLELATGDKVVVFSAETREGRDEVWNEILASTRNDSI
ncbi:YihA family ribosome biogenesis GTP-binding protein [Marinilactibacillus sp. 15R]|uniref:Probable GTP-binding protein EngB n=1 Tax=Marinilactibacillus piezotolerans TaxID=258723 RepID=A0A1I3UX83_9LACT|nr:MULTISPECIES: ribosome biogenesis GTP-binding protein YihA/YsxC [Marinilactibacillus]API89328.1 YihA family ribosome biogenesis GTP-binding protein [Marinilactibacillus sp. 15R]SFJ86706.1 GTP-binding protein [Marinilactibacillus piezotolerans]